MWLGYQAGKGFSDITLIKKGETSVYNYRAKPPATLGRMAKAMLKYL